MQAMIFAAGLGTRLKPLTDTMPKAMVRVGGKPLLWHVLMKLKRAGVQLVVVNVHHFARQIVDYLSENDNFGMDIRVSDETDCLLDTGGGLRKAAPLFRRDMPILIHNVDIMSNVDLRALAASAAGHDALLLVSRRVTKRYLLFDEATRLAGWTNIATGEVRSPNPQFDPAKCRRYAFSGIHVVQPSLLDMMKGWPDRFGIIDFYLDVCARADIHGLPQGSLRLLDVGKLDTLEQAERFVTTV